MNIAVDIGNTRLKCGFFPHNGVAEVHFLRIPPNKEEFDKLMAAYPQPLTWWIAQTGGFHWRSLKAAILNARSLDKFEIMTRRQIPLKTDVDLPQKVGIDRLLAALAATGKYGDTPMLLVDAGSAITVDVVQHRTFCGGAILPGIVAAAKVLPQISEKLPLVSISDRCSAVRPAYPGKNTKDAIHNGIYWGTIGAIRQFYEMFAPRTKRLILTGGNARYLLPGLSQVISSCRIMHHDTLVLEGINLLAAEHSGGKRIESTR